MGGVGARFVILKMEFSIETTERSKAEKSIKSDLFLLWYLL